MQRAIDLLNERINWLEDEIKDLQNKAEQSISRSDGIKNSGWSIACGLLELREKKVTAMLELKAVLAECIKELK